MNAMVDSITDVGRPPSFVGTTPRPSEIASLYRREVFWAVMSTPPGIFPMGYKWVFIHKRNENNEVVRYKAMLVAQGFTQKRIDFNETYSPVMNGITF
jgi:hypothetical protein